MQCIGGIAIYGWFHDQPTWLFPWLGYCLVPVVTAGILLMYLPGSWAWVAFLPYVILAFMLLGFIGKQMIKKDWLLVSLTILPVPIVIGWLLLRLSQTVFLLLLTRGWSEAVFRWIYRMLSRDADMPASLLFFHAVFSQGIRAG